MAGADSGAPSSSDAGGALETEEGAESVEEDALLMGLVEEWRERERARREGKAAKKREKAGRGKVTKGGKAGRGDEEAGAASARDIRSLFPVIKKRECGVSGG